MYIPAYQPANLDYLSPRSDSALRGRCGLHACIHNCQCTPDSLPAQRRDEQRAPPRIRSEPDGRGVQGLGPCWRACSFFCPSFLVEYIRAPSILLRTTMHCTYQSITSYIACLHTNACLPLSIYRYMLYMHIHTYTYTPKRQPVNQSAR